MNKHQDTNLITAAKEVLRIESEAIASMMDHLGEDFNATIKAILSCQGRTILTGIGKSGHIANKIASTLASTGTPAFFVHPAEAAHGDLGMIITGDIVLALSNSGESEEILTLMPALKRKGVLVIAMTNRAESSLAKHADIHLMTNIHQEACPLGLAPTTSTTVSLALGDAIAVCLLKERHFTSNDFALSHPAGSLGKSLLIRVADIMIKDHDIPKVLPDASLQEVIIVMTNKGLGLAAVVDTNNQVLGIFTDGDLRRLFQQQPEIKQFIIVDIMTHDPKTISPDVLASEALHLMQANKIASLLAIDKNQKLLGVITMHQLLSSGII